MSIVKMISKLTPEQHGQYTMKFACKERRAKRTRSDPIRVRPRVFARIIPRYPGRIRIIWRDIRKVERDLDDWE